MSARTSDSAPHPVAAGIESTAPGRYLLANPLGLDWPGELVHIDLPANAISGDAVVQMGDQIRPAQVERLRVGSRRIARVWFVVTMAGLNPKAIAIRGGAAPSVLTVTRSQTRNQLTVYNGVARFHLPDFAGKFAPPRPLKSISPLVAGIATGEDREVPCKSWFEGDALVTGARTELVAHGPVFATVKITYEIAGGGKGGRCRYTAQLRFVAGDPWIDVTEKYSLPSDTRYCLEMRDRAHFDTAMLVPWMPYGAAPTYEEPYLRFLPLRAQSRQQGAFAALRPKWSQMPGSGQEFFVTSGGPSPDADGRNAPMAVASAYDPEATAIGVVATYPMRWLPPYPQTIEAYAEKSDTARLEFPLRAGARTYALVVGPRHLFDSTQKLNSLVRRRSDWTLDDQLHKYILTWKRDPSLAGPHIVIACEELRQLQEEYRAGRDSPKTRLLREYVAKKATLRGQDPALLALLTGEPIERPKPPTAQEWVTLRYQDDKLNPTHDTRAVKRGLAWADLFAGGQPMGGPWQAALGYIFSDLNQWPGYNNGWGVGNPNFHTDKYGIAVLAGAALLDHPDSWKWLAFGKQNFEDDQKKVLLPIDGVGYECPGYSLYSLDLLLGIGKVFQNIGHRGTVTRNSLFKRTGVWHRSLLTPVDPRIQIRHQAPIGDTHRWGEAEGAVFGKLAAFYKRSDPSFASEMMGIWKLYRSQGMSGSLTSDLLDIDPSIPPMPPDRMDWKSRAFYGFGSILRSRFGTSRETFVSFKAGPARGHYHNDELSYHFYGAGMPISLDYNCSYHPRGDHQALHNSMTFGLTRPFMHPGDLKPIEAVEQLSGIARLGAFRTTPVADVSVAEVEGNTLQLAPLEPDQARFQFDYPIRRVSPIVHRRFLILVKHPVGSRLEDYLVVREETRSREPQQLNIHLLARDVRREGPLFRSTGQWDADALVYLAQSCATDVRIGRWYYAPDARKDPVGHLEGAAWIQKIRETDGEALIPPVGWKDRWTEGEYQKWLRIETKPGTPILWVLYPHRRNEPEPRFETLAESSGVRVVLGGEAEEVYVNTVPAAGTAGQVVIRRSGRETVVLRSDAVPPLGRIKAGPAVDLSGRLIDDAGPLARPGH